MGLYRKRATTRKPEGNEATEKTSAGSPYWYATWLAPVTDPATGRIKRRADGAPVTQQVHRSTKKKLKSEAQAALRRWEGEAARLLALTTEEEGDRLLARRAAEAEEARERQERARSAFTLADLRDLWLKHAAPKKSIAADRVRFDVILEMLGRERPIVEITSADIVAFRDAILERKTERGNKPHSKATVNRYIALLRASLRAASETYGHTHADPMRGVRMLREDNERDRICTREEYERIIGAARPELRRAIVLAYNTGMRQGDIASLTWDAIDLPAKLIRVRAESEKIGAARAIPITDEVVKELAAIEPKEGPLFPYRPRKEGRTHGAGPTLSSWFAELVRELGIPDLRFHDLRHTASTNLRRSGADLFTLAALTGHKDLATLKRYQTITVDDLRTAVERTAKAQKATKRGQR